MEFRGTRNLTSRPFTHRLVVGGSVLVIPSPFSEKEIVHVCALATFAWNVTVPPVCGSFVGVTRNDTIDAGRPGDVVGGVTIDVGDAVDDGRLEEAVPKPIAMTTAAAAALSRIPVPLCRLAGMI